MEKAKYDYAEKREKRFLKESKNLKSGAKSENIRWKGPESQAIFKVVELE